MRAFPLDARTPSYQALSYCWGDAAERRVIECNGRRTLVGRNLHSALSRLRDARSPMTLWADALCINQSEDDDALVERGKQVEIMDKIYSQASLVYVDLCKEVAEMNDILQLLRGFDIIPHDLNIEREKVMEAFERFHLPGIEDPRWPHVVRFLTRPWFRRVWVMQEFILAKKVQILVGHRRLESNFLRWLVLAALYFDTRITSLPSDFSTRPDFYRSYFRLRTDLNPAGRNLAQMLEARQFQLDDDIDYGTLQPC